MICDLFWKPKPIGTMNVEERELRLAAYIQKGYMSFKIVSENIVNIYSDKDNARFLRTDPEASIPYKENERECFEKACHLMLNGKKRLPNSSHNPIGLTTPDGEWHTVSYYFNETYHLMIKFNKKRYGVIMPPGWKIRWRVL